MLISRWRSSDEAHRLRLPLPRLIIRGASSPRKPTVTKPSKSAVCKKKGGIGCLAHKMAARTPATQVAGGAYVVQVSAQKTEDEARASYQVLQQKYSERSRRP